MSHDLIGKLDPDVPVTFLYGEKSKYRNGGGEQVNKGREVRYKGQSARVNVFHIPKVKHHLQVEDYKSFNEKVKEILSEIDSQKDLQYGDDSADCTLHPSGSCCEISQKRIGNSQKKATNSSRSKTFQSRKLYSANNMFLENDQEVCIKSQKVKSRVIGKVQNTKTMIETNSHSQHTDCFQYSDGLQPCTYGQDSGHSDMQQSYEDYRCSSSQAVNPEQKNGIHDFTEKLELANQSYEIQVPHIAATYSSNVLQSSSSSSSIHSPCHPQMEHQEFGQDGTSKSDWKCIIS